MSTTKDKINFQNTWSCNKTTGRRSGNLQSIRRLLEHDTSSSVCPSCRISFDKGKRRKLIDTCGHERCYSCMFRNDQCPMCMNSSLKDVDCSSNAQGYDTGIGGSTSTIVSPLGSPQPQLRSQVQRANAAALARYMQRQFNNKLQLNPQWDQTTTTKIKTLVFVFEKSTPKGTQLKNTTSPACQAGWLACSFISWAIGSYNSIVRCDRSFTSLR
ncbi:uncharacterized protein LOC133326672 [Musca vetustissima]|uniref:uncharacterized protein LOC133326672 n=1 Tax=Musca vetustissima TaxID=27455 RepID=UPI002AB61ECC|nr:uncharacterized protein LOC133326672 [Musca vetustissima]